MSRILSILCCLMLFCGLAEAVEPDESGIGGTGHTEIDNGILDQLEMPERIEPPVDINIFDGSSMMQMNESGATDVESATPTQPTQ
ncbi:MAG: hypothetical protein OEZ43_16615 [Gammaproteobacteria bacterium]|nr:hypothetical protein [Gammaproteobacteria bacterium]